MNKYLKWVLIFSVSSAVVIFTGYGAYRLYNYLVEDATKRIKQGVAEGVSGAMNPLSWPGKILGGGGKS